MSKKKLAKNAILNLIKTISSAIFPLITFPYISRILGVENLGAYNFSTSVISYFTLIAGLGITNYAIREGARYREDNKKLSKFSSEVFTINVISTILAYVLMFICIFLFDELRKYVSVILILSVAIMFTTLGCEWVYNIYEDFKYITIRSIAFQVISLILLFVFVRDSNDLLAYSIITVIASSGANVINIIARKKYLKIGLSFNKNLKKHLVPIFVLFANSIAMTIYINSDMTILGIMTGDYYTGLYSVSTKVYTVIKSLLGAMIVVSIPHLVALIGKKDLTEYRNTSKGILNVLLSFCVPTMIGIFCISKYIILLLSGEDYVSATSSLQILSFALLFSIISWYYTSCVLIPFRKEKIVLAATTSSAIANVVLNILLVPKFNINATAFTTMLAELISAAVCYIYGRKYTQYRPPLNIIMSILIGSVGIYACCYIVAQLFSSVLLVITFSIAFSALIYMLVLILFKNPTISTFSKLIKQKN